MSAKRVLRMVDFFAGIGGTRLGFERAGFECVYSNEIDAAACETYNENFGENPYGDIKTVKASTLPDFDVLVAGFPCQAFSLAGKKNGLNDKRGKLFFDLARVVKEKKPKAFLLENVAHIRRHNNGKTFAAILGILQNDLKYKVYYKVVNAKNFGLPQNRPRIFIAGFRHDINVNGFGIPESNSSYPKTIREIKEKNVAPHYYVSKRWYAGMKRHKKRHEKRGNGFGFVILGDNEIANTLVCGGMGKERNLVVDKISARKFSTEYKKKFNKKFVRYLTPREMARLQGFPESFKLPDAKTRAYKQIANSAPVPMIREVAKHMREVLENNRN